MAISGICTYLFIIPKIHLMRLRIYFFAIGNAIVLVLPIAIVFVNIFIVVVVMQMMMAIGKL